MTKALVNRFLFIFLLFVVPIHLSAQDQVAGKVYFNHLWVAINTEDFQAILNSEFIKKQFGAIDFHSSKTRSGDEWKGIYFYGVTNYFEFLDEQAQNIQSGSSGVGFSVEEAGQLKHLKEELHHDFGKHVHAQKQTKIDGAAKVDWYEAIFVNDEVHFEDTTLYYWVLEYSPDYFENQGIPLDDQKKEVTTEKYLGTWAKAREGKHFQKVTGLTIDLHHQEYEVFSRFLSSIGFRKTSQHTFEGPDEFEIRIEELDISTPTVTSIRMALQNPVDKDEVMQFGSMTSLHLRTDGTAEWVFK